MDYKQDCTKGVFSNDLKTKDDKEPIHVFSGEKLTLASEICVIYGAETLEQEIANAKLITETFNVLSGTGFTPLELVEQVRVLRNVLNNIKDTADNTIQHRDFIHIFEQAKAALSSTEPINKPK